MSKHTCISVNFLVLMVALHLRRRESLFAGNNTKKYSGVLGHQTHTSFQMVRDEMFFVSCCVVLVAQSRLTLCDPMDYSPPGSSVCGILQAGTLEWVAIYFSNARKGKVKVKSLSRVQLLAASWTVA